MQLQTNIQRLITFLMQATSVHLHLYNYTKVVYINARKKVIIGCNIHGDFVQSPSFHVRGGGCPCCAKNKRRSNVDQFIEKANKVHNNIYTYKNAQYVTATVKLIITCSVHGDFVQSPNNHLSGQGCAKCTKQSHRKSNTIDFIKKAEIKHNSVYNYSSVNYLHAKSKVDIICNLHGVFLQTPMHHLWGLGCPKCANNGYSKLAIDWIEAIMRVQSIFIQHAGNIGEYVISGTKYKVDGYHKDTNTVYEFYGDYFHGNPKRYIANTYNKLLSKTMEELHQATISREQKIRELGYNLVAIWEYDYLENTIKCINTQEETIP